jgi:hypothetical protein
MPKQKAKEDIRWVDHEMLGNRAVVSLVVSAHRINQTSQEVAAAFGLWGSASASGSAVAVASVSLL